MEKLLQVKIIENYLPIILMFKQKIIHFKRVILGTESERSSSRPKIQKQKKSERRRAHGFRRLIVPDAMRNGRRRTKSTTLRKMTTISTKIGEDLTSDLESEVASIIPTVLQYQPFSRKRQILCPFSDKRGKNELKNADQIIKQRKQKARVQKYQDFRRKENIKHKGAPRGGQKAASHGADGGSSGKTGRKSRK